MRTKHTTKKILIATLCVALVLQTALAGIAPRTNHTRKTTRGKASTSKVARRSENKKVTRKATSFLPPSRQGSLLALTPPVLQAQFLRLPQSFSAELNLAEPTSDKEKSLDAQQKSVQAEEQNEAQANENDRASKTEPGTAATVNSQVYSKIAPDLMEQIQGTAANSSGNELVRVIAQTEDQATLSDLRYLRLHGGQSVKIFPDFKMMVLALPAKEIESLAARNNIHSLSPDRTVNAADSHIRKTTGVSAALSTADLKNLNGNGIGIAVLDSGVQADHKDIANGKPSESKMVSISFVTGTTDTGDAYGHGTHVASLAAGTGDALQDYSGQFTGIAPNARIINVRVLGANGSGSTSDVIAGINWCIANKNVYNIRVMNLSLGALTPESYKTDPLCQAAERAVKAGIVVVAAAGNSGRGPNNEAVYGSIHSPAIDPMVLTVGAVTTWGTDVRSDDTVASYSSRGPTYTDRLLKPDLVAPGNKLVGAQADNNALVTAHPQLDFMDLNQKKRDMMMLSGTSMAAPVVSGTVALMLQKNPALTPSLVKAVLQYTAQRLPHFNILEQGAGELNAEGALRLTAAIPTTLPTSVKAPFVSVMPTPQSSFNGESFNWFGSIYGGYNWIFSGSTLFTKYQAIYNLGFRWVGKEVSTNGISMSEGILFSDGISMSEGILLADGISMSEGILLADGISMSEGILLADGMTMSEGILLADNLLLPNGQTLANVYVSSSSFSALSTLSALSNRWLILGDQ